ncbi:hypothetical protein MPSEU_000682100 [Mayamaea pseudoterrestris]|nr:hypothetical protein MPSEU_000682100 [Mayamaea pseudoterrestris]
MQTGGRYASAPRMGGTPQAQTEPYASHRSMTPNRYLSTATDHDGQEMQDLGTPSSTGLIRLSLKKPMGIVFEPMYDPNQKSLQRGVRICDLPRTGAAALSRKLQVGDELLQINDRTVSRLNFDQIMDIIIEADPESVNLLFRRPRKETLQARQGVKQKLAAAANKDQPSTVKWVDNGLSPPKDKKEKKKEKKSKRNKKNSVSEDETETLQSSMNGDESYIKPVSRKTKKLKGKSSRKDPYESESFLDVLIDTICANSNNVCRVDTFRRPDDEYFSDEEESFASDVEDESTYVTYDESIDQKHMRRKKKQALVDEGETEDDNTRQETTDDDEPRQQKKDMMMMAMPEQAKYEDDGTLETNESEGRMTKPLASIPNVHQAPLGLAPKAIHHPQALPPVIEPPVLPIVMPPPEIDQEVNVPIKELEYDDRFDQADVSVMESLGGPSLLIEKQRAMNGFQQKQQVPRELIENFGLDFPPKYGFTREQTIADEPVKFYGYVVKTLLHEHEPEKVKLLDKLLNKYKGREDHLVHKLSVRYDRPPQEQTPRTTEENVESFTDAVKKNKSSSQAANAVYVAKERMHMVNPPSPVRAFDNNEWPNKETKEQDVGDDDEGGSGSGSVSEYSSDSVDGTSPAVIAQVSELLNYVYGKTSVPGQIDRVSTIMRAYEGREAVLLELLETKALLKANNEKEQAGNLPSFVRSNQGVMHEQKSAEGMDHTKLPPVTPMATHAVNHDDISSMSGVSSPVIEREQDPSGIVSHAYETEDVEVTHNPSIEHRLDLSTDVEGPQVSTAPTSTISQKIQQTPESKNKKKGFLKQLFHRKKQDGGRTPASTRTVSRLKK